MKSIFFAIFFIVFQAINTVATAQTEVLSENNKLDLELAEIKRQRLLIESKFKTREADCYKNFAVNQCLQERKSEKLLELQETKRRELAINEQKRQIKAEGIHKKATGKSEKFSNRAQSVEAVLTPDAPEASNPSHIKVETPKPEKSNLNKHSDGSEPRNEKPRLLNKKGDARVPKDLAQQAQRRTEVAKQRVLEASIKQATSQRKAQARAKKRALVGGNEAKFNQKQGDAQKHKTAVEKASLEKIKPKSAPLPIPDLNALKK